MRIRADKRVDGVVVQHRHGRLQDDRTTIELGRDQMHGGAADPHTVLERLALRIEARKCRQQRRMNVEDAVRKRIEQWRPDEAHEPGEADQIDVARLSTSTSAAIVGVTIGVSRG